MATTYVTPAGFICTCGATRVARAGGEASRAAHVHSQTEHISKVVVIDLRQGVSQKRREAVALNKQ